jgi:hypothetical protein
MRVLRGETLLERRDHVRDEFDELPQALLWEPRYLGVQGRVVEMTEKGGDTQLTRWPRTNLGKDTYPLQIAPDKPSSAFSGCQLRRSIWCHGPQTRR